MIAIWELLHQLRAQRRRTVQALSALAEEQLKAHVGPERPANIRFTILSLAQDEDRRCATLGDVFSALQWQPTEVQRILGGLAQTRGQLRAALVGLTEDDLDRAPAPEEWAVRQVLRHVMNNERRFVSDSRYAIERLRSAEPLPLASPEGPQPPGSLGPEAPGSLEDVLEALERVRDEVVAGSAALTAEELAAPMPWAGLPMDVRFMLERRATHEREHSVQIYKTPYGVGFHQTEAQMLMGQAEIARGALEGMLLGVPDELVDRSPGGGLPSVARLLSEGRAEEEAKVSAILSALG